MAKEEKGKLVDPVTESQALSEQEEQAQEAFNMNALSLEDFQPVPVTAARQPHPFEGYPQPKVQLGVFKPRGRAKDEPLMISKTWIIALNPKEFVYQDPSGKGVSILSGGAEKIVNLKTYHNRIVRDQMGQNVNVVFDRDIALADGKTLERVAICPDHTARAQIMFTVDKKTGKINVDRRYVLADIGQVSRLRRLFEMFHYQQTQSERLAQKFDEEPESLAQ